MSHTRFFNRHENMSELTRSVVMHLINVESIRKDYMGICNMLYGLFDGYDYTDAIMERADEIGIDHFSPEHRLLDSLCREVKTYPEGKTMV
jgi:hypothetical protein